MLVVGFIFGLWVLGAACFGFVFWVLYLMFAFVCCVGTGLVFRVLPRLCVLSLAAYSPHPFFNRKERPAARCRNFDLEFGFRFWNWVLDLEF